MKNKSGDVKGGGNPKVQSLESVGARSFDADLEEDFVDASAVSLTTTPQLLIYTQNG